MEGNGSNGCYTCASCGGVFLNLKMAKEKIPSFSALDTKFSESQYGCPNGCGPMHSIKLKAIELEICKTCFWTWFDKGEINEIAKRNRSEFNMPKPLFEDWDFRKASDVAELVFEILSLFIWFY